MSQSLQTWQVYVKPYTCSRPLFNISNHYLWLPVWHADCMYDHNYAGRSYAMKKLRMIAALAVLIAMVTGAGCSHMSTTQQRALSGGAIGAGGGAALTALTGGSILWGTAIGAGVGAVGGLIYDDCQKKK